MFCLQEETAVRPPAYAVVQYRMDIVLTRILLMAVKRISFSTVYNLCLNPGLSRKLQGSEPGVQGTRRQKGFMGARINKPAIIKNSDAVGVDHCGKPMGNGHRGAAVHNPFQGLLDETLVFRIKSAGGFIEQGVPPDHAGWRGRWQCAVSGLRIDASLSRLETY